MKKADIQIGATYLVKVTGNLVTVKIDRENPRGGWDGTNLKTKRSVRIKSAQRMRRRVADASRSTTTPDEHRKRHAKEAATTKATNFAGLTGSAFTDAINAADVGALRTALADGGKLTAKQRGRIEAALAHKIKTPAAKPAAKTTPPPAKRITGKAEREQASAERAAQQVRQDIAKTVQAVEKGDLAKGVMVPTRRRKRGGGITEANKADAVNAAMLAVEADKKKRMSGLDAAAKVLADATEPLSTKVMVECMLAKGLWTTNGKTPSNTLYTAWTMLAKAG